MTEVVACPRCGSSQISAHKRGLSVKGAAIGAGVGLLTLGLGIGAAGGAALGMNKIICTCLACGQQWKAGAIAPTTKYPISTSSKSSRSNETSSEEFISPWCPIVLQKAVTPTYSRVTIFPVAIGALLFLYTWPNVAGSILVGIATVAATLVLNSIVTGDRRTGALEQVPEFDVGDQSLCVDGVRIFGVTKARDRLCILRILEKGAEYRVLSRTDVEEVSLVDRTDGGHWVNIVTNDSHERSVALFFREKNEAEKWHAKIERAIGGGQ